MKWKLFGEEGKSVFFRLNKNSFVVAYDCELIGSVMLFTNWIWYKQVYNKLLPGRPGREFFFPKQDCHYETMLAPDWSIHYSTCLRPWYVDFIKVIKKYAQKYLFKTILTFCQLQMDVGLVGLDFYPNNVMPWCSSARTMDTLIAACFLCVYPSMPKWSLCTMCVRIIAVTPSRISIA